MEGALLTGITVLALLLYGFLTFRSPHWAIFLLLAGQPVLIFLTGLDPWTIGPFSFIGSIKDVLLVVVFAVLLIRTVHQGEILRSSFDQLTLFVLAYAVWIVFCSLRAPTALAAFSAVRAYTEFILVYFAVKYAIRSEGEARLQYVAILVGGLSALIIGADRLGEFDFAAAGSGRSRGRFSGIFPTEEALGSDFLHPGVGGGVNMFGMYLVIVLLVALPFAIQWIKKPWIRWTFLVGVAFAAFQLALTFSRRAFVAAAVALLFLLFTPGMRKYFIRWAFVGSLLVLAGLFLFSPGGGVSENSGLQALGSSLQSIELDLRDEQRWYEMSVLTERTLASFNVFLFGEGLGTVGIAQRVTLGWGTLHNSYLSLMVQTGLVGLLLLLLVVATAVYYGLRLSFSKSPWNMYAAVATAVTLALCVSAIAGDTLAVYPSNFFFWFFLGVLSTIHRYALRRTAAATTTAPDRAASRSIRAPTVDPRLVDGT